MITWLEKLAAAFRVELSKETLAAYLEVLVARSPEVLQVAFQRTITEWNEASKMPPLAFIIARCGDDPKLLAEQAWDLVWKLVKRDWYADGIGWVNGAEKKLTPAMQYAIRCCKGEYRMAYATDDEFPFIRRDFMEAHQRFTAEGGEQARLSHAEAKGILDELLGGFKKLTE